MLKTFLISPVRDADHSFARSVVNDLEKYGYIVHWPVRDTDQDDITGLRICSDNLRAIETADVVHFIWDGKSQGCLFDLGMAFALGKVVIPVSMPQAEPGVKSFQNMVAEYYNVTMDYERRRR